MTDVLYTTEKYWEDLFDSLGFKCRGRRSMTKRKSLGVIELDFIWEKDGIYVKMFLGDYKFFVYIKETDTILAILWLPNRYLKDLQMTVEGIADRSLLPLCMSIPWARYVVTHLLRNEDD